MAAKTPIRGDYNGSDLVGLSEFLASEFVDISDGGTGATNASDARTALGLAIGSDIQAYHVNLADISSLAVTDGGIIVGDGNNFVLETGDTARTSLGLGTTDSPTFNNLILSGNLTVSGTTTSINTETINLADNNIVLNSNATGSALEDAGITIERGDDPNKTLIWDETNDYWTVGSETFVAANFAGSLSGTSVLADGVTATTQAALDNSTKVATTEYVDSAVAQENELAEMNDVTLTNSQNGDFLRYNGSVWINDAVDLATDTVGDFVQSITGGDGLAIDVTSGEAQTPTLSVNVDDSSIEISSDSLQVKALGITNAMLAGSIENAKLVNSDITFTDGTTPTVASLGDTITFTGGTGVTIANTAGNFDFSFDIAEVKSQVDEYAQDALYDAFVAGTQTLITVAYDDNANSVSYTVENDLSLYDNTTSAFITLTSLSAPNADGVSYDNANGQITLANIPNSSLTNSSVSVSDGTTSTAISLGDTITFTGGAGVDIVNTAGTLDFTFDLTEVASEITEAAQDAIDALLTAGTQTRITVSYNDVANSLSYTVDDDLANYDNTNTAFIDLTDLSATSATGVTYDNLTGTIALASIPNSSLTNSSVTINANALSLGGTLTLVTDDIAEDVSPTNLYFTDERAQDAIDAAFSAGTQTRITYAYDDNANSYSLTVDDDLSNYDNTTSAFITADSTDTLTNKTFDANGTGNSISNIEVADLAGSAVVIESEGIASNDNDTTLPTSAAVKDYVDTQITAQDLDITDGTTTSAVDLDSQTLTIQGTANQVDVSVSGQVFTVALPNDVTIAGNLTVQGTTTQIDSNTVNIGDNILVLNSDETGTPSQNAGIEIERGTDTNVSLVWDETNDYWTVGSKDFVATNLTGTLSATSVLADGVTATTQSVNDNSTKVATTAYVDAQVTLQDLDFAGDSGTGQVDLDSQTLTVTGGTGITTTASSQSVTIDIDSTVATLTGTQTLTNKTLGATTIAGHLIPDTDVSYDLGSSALKFRDLYLSGSSIYLNTNTITLNSGNYEFSDGSNVITMPIASTDTLVAKNTTDVLSNKTVVDTDNTMVKTIVVDVTAGKFRFNGQSEAILNLEANQNYRFDTSHTSLATDPFALSETVDGSNTEVSSTYVTDEFDPSQIISDTITFTAAHGLTTGDEIVYDQNADFEIDGLTNGTKYYAIVVSSTEIQVAASTSDAAAGTQIAIANGSATTNQLFRTYTYTYGSEYTTGLTTVGTQGQAGSYKELRVHTTTPTLFPFSSANSNRGGNAKGRPERVGRFVGLDTDDVLINKTLDLELNTIKITYAVTVAVGSDGNNKYFIDGEETASLALVSGFTYIFDLSDSSTATHPFRLNTGKDGTGTALTAGVTYVGTQGQSGAYVQIAVNSTTPDLVYYYCTSHSGMGGNSVLTVAGADLSTQTTDDLTQGTSNFYYSDTYVDNHLSGGTGIDYTTGTISVEDSIITAQSTKASPVGTDQVLIYDVSGTSLKKITIQDIVSQAGAGSMSSFTLSDGSLTTPITDADTLTVSGVANETTVAVGTDTLTIGLADEITADINGAIHVKAKNESGATITKGTPVYISGQSGSGQEFTVDVADADDSAKMPAVGIAYADSNNNSEITIVTHGKFIGIDTSSFSVGDDVYVSTTGTLTSTIPTGETSGIQKIAKVIRSHASTGQIYVMGASRTNATPNLDDGDIFIGNASNQAVTASLNTKISDYLGAGGDITIGGNLIVQGSTTTVNQTEINVQNAFVFEGATADAFETTLSIEDPTADRIITLPDDDGTIALNTSALITGQSALVGSIDTANDLVLLYDASATSLTKVDVATLLASAGAGSFNDFTLQADTGTPEVVADGNTVTFTGGTGIDTSVSATDTINIAIDSTVLTTSSNLNDLANVNAGSPQNGESLVYNSSSGKWEPSYVSGGGGGGTADSIKIVNYLGIEKFITVSNSEIPFIEYDGSSDTSDPLPISNSVLDFQETADGVTFVDDDIQLAVAEDTFSVIVDTAGDTAVTTEETGNQVGFFTQGLKRGFVDELGFSIGEDGMGFRNPDKYDATTTVPSGQNMMMAGPITFSGTITVQGRLVIV